MEKYVFCYQTQSGWYGGWEKSENDLMKVVLDYSKSPAVFDVAYGKWQESFESLSASSIAKILKEEK